MILAHDAGAEENFQYAHGEAWFRPVGAAHWLSLGDVTMVEDQHEVRTRPVKRPSRHGFLRTVREDLLELSMAFTVELQEQLPIAVELALWGRRETALSLPALVSEPVTMTAIPGATFDLGRINIESYSVAVPTRPFATEGVDYVVDKAGGTIYFPYESLLNQAAVTVTFSVARQVFGSVTGGVSGPLQGRFRIDGWMDSGLLLRREFDASVTCPQGPKLDGQFFSQSLKVVALSEVSEVRLGRRRVATPCYFTDSNSVSYRLQIENGAVVFVPITPSGDDFWAGAHRFADLGTGGFYTLGINAAGVPVYTPVAGAVPLASRFIFSTADETAFYCHALENGIPKFYLI